MQAQIFLTFRLAKTWVYLVQNEHGVQTAFKSSGDRKGD